MYALIGARIKKAREKKFISQAELGARLGVTATAINYYEKGKRKINIEDLFRLAAALEKPVEYFLPANPVYPPIILNSETELVIQGVYAGVFKFPSGSPRAL
jgi:transcriptional regulator with XRE-family HTH domain